MSGTTKVMKIENAFLPPYRREKTITLEEAQKAFRQANLYSGAYDDLMAGKEVHTANDTYRLVRS